MVSGGSKRRTRLDTAAVLRRVPLVRRGSPLTARARTPHTILKQRSRPTPPFNSAALQRGPRAAPPTFASARRPTYPRLPPPPTQHVPGAGQPGHHPAGAARCAPHRLRRRDRPRAGHQRIPLGGGAVGRGRPVWGGACRLGCLIANGLMFGFKWGRRAGPSTHDASRQAFPPLLMHALSETRTPGSSCRPTTVTPRARPLPGLFTAAPPCRTRAPRPSFPPLIPSYPILCRCPGT